MAAGADKSEATNQEEEGNTQMNQGKVKFYRPEKYYGFIAPDGHGKDLFFHGSEIYGSCTVLSPGDLVTYDIGKSAKGVCATKVRRVADKPVSFENGPAY
jgi:CspA family cold shock protein